MQTIQRSATRTLVSNRFCRGRSKYSAAGRPQRSISSTKTGSPSSDNMTTAIMGDLVWKFSPEKDRVDIRVVQIEDDDGDQKDDESTVPTQTNEMDQIPATVLQYERHLRKVQAEQRANRTDLTAEKHLKIIYEDEAILVTDKPSGVLCVPGLHGKPSLLDLVYSHCNAPMSQPAKMVVHRLDMDTSGLVMFAKTETALKTLQAAFRDRQVDKEYHALVCGHLNPLHVMKGDMHLPLQRDHVHPPFMRTSTPASEVAAALAVKDLQTHGWKKLVMKRPKPSHTEFAVLGREMYQSRAADKSENQEMEFPVTRISLIPHTGRTHQLRVHCAALGHPIVGDPTYGLYGEANPRGGLQGYSSSAGGASFELQKSLNGAHKPHDNPMCLHATKLQLKHPISGDMITFNAPTPF